MSRRSARRQARYAHNTHVRREAHKHKLSRVCCNTSGYMTLQVLQGCHDPNKSDICSLGATLYQLRTGYLPGKIDMLRIKLLHFKKRNDYPLYGRAWLECDQRMNDCGQNMWQHNDRRRHNAYEPLHREREMQRSYVPMSRHVAECNVIEHRMHIV